MSAQNKPAIEDMDDLIEIHGHFTDRVNDMALTFQDASYNMGRQRGLLDGKTQRDELLTALQELLTDMVIAQGNMRHAAKRDTSWEGCAEAVQPRVDAARAAIAKVEGGAG